ncbi:hypothetical protein PG993_009256 [Apiospora rasikravindrae]|uniref:Catalase n=1 Tax=Apiospora rasikravindrae TaxID=990691 RepID=A0ABR1SIV1_9PEZI
MDDWEDTVLSSRHMHNRVGGRAGKSKAGDRSHGDGGGFDVRKSFGTYEVKLGKGKKTSTSSSSTLEILRLTADGRGVIGDLHLEGAVTATVLMAGSRKVLNAIVDGFGDTDAPSGSEARLEEDEDGNEDGERNQADDENDVSNNADAGVDANLETGAERESLEERQPGRFETFEKNSFRSPKFWLRFHGHESRADGAAERSGTGYLVFSGNDCRKFEGTISCDAINWDNKKLSGWKTIARSERDTPVFWHGQEVS